MKNNKMLEINLTNEVEDLNTENNKEIQLNLYIYPSFSDSFPI